jgi:hypothetical protein
MKLSTLTPAAIKGPILRSLLVALLFLISVLPGNVISSSQATAQVSASNFCGVTDEEVVHYMREYGYTVYRVEPEPGTCNRIITTQNPYKTIVFISNGSIVGWEDIANN